MELTKAGHFEREQSVKLAERVEKLYRAHTAGARESVRMEIGELEIERNEGEDINASIMRAVARRVMPRGWEWDVVSVVGGAVHFIVKGRNHLEVPDGACCANEDRGFAGGCRSCGAPCL